MFIAYAIRFKVDEIFLFYPNTIKNYQQKEVGLKIKDAFANEKEISINAFQLPILNKDLLSNNLNPRKNLNELFEMTRNVLKEKIAQILLKEDFHFMAD